VEQDEAAILLCKALLDNGINVTLKSAYFSLALYFFVFMRVTLIR
jgi:hypothetical protein